MKSIHQGITEWFFSVCCMFTGSTLLFMLIAFLSGQKTISIETLFSILILSAAGTFIQFLAFTNYIIKKMRYTRRLLLFMLLFLPVLSLCALCFRWFPAAKVGSWILFVIIFLAVFIIMTIGFEIYYHAAGRKYDGLLGQYKAKLRD